MAAINEGRPLPELIGGLASDISTLFRKEIELAKAETSEKVSQAMGAAGSIAIGGVLALGALGVLLSAVVSLVSAMFIAWGMSETTATTLAAALVGIIVAAIAWVMIQKGLNALKGSNLKLERTSSSLGRDARMVKEKL